MLLGVPEDAVPGEWVRFCPNYMPESVVDEPTLDLGSSRPGLTDEVRQELRGDGPEPVAFRLPPGVSETEHELKVLGSGAPPQPPPGPGPAVVAGGPPPAPLPPPPVPQSTLPAGPTDVGGARSATVTQRRVYTAGVGGRQPVVPWTPCPRSTGGKGGQRAGRRFAGLVGSGRLVVELVRRWLVRLSSQCRPQRRGAGAGSPSRLERVAQAPGGYGGRG